MVLCVGEVADNMQVPLVSSVGKGAGNLHGLKQCFWFCVLVSRAGNMQEPEQLFGGMCWQGGRESAFRTNQSSALVTALVVYVCEGAGTKKYPSSALVGSVYEGQRIIKKQSNALMVLSCQPRVTVTSCFVYTVIRDLG